MKTTTSAALVLVLAASAAAAATLNVGVAGCSDTTGTPYCSIQAAIDAAVDGDVIVIATGSYDERLYIEDKSLTLQGAGSATTDIEAAGLGPNAPVIWIRPALDDCVVLSTLPVPRVRPPFGPVPTVNIEGLRVHGGETASVHGPLFNGDDAIVLRRVSDTQVIDSIGQAGVDPGNEWGSGLTSTQNNTLTRNANNCTGDTNATNVFTPSANYTGSAKDTTTGLGAHTPSGCTPTTLLFTQYVDGSRWNLALEIFNGTGTPIDLSGYRVEIYRNGNSCTDHIIALSGILPDGNTFVLKSSGADLAGITGATGGNGSSIEGNQIRTSASGISSEWATLNLTDVVADTNVGGEGAVWNNFGTATMADSEVTGNSSSGIYNDHGTMTVTNSEVTNNASGGIENWFGTIAIDRSMVAGNTTGSSYGGGGIYTDNGTTSIVDSTIDNNQNNTGFARTGGGIGQDNGTLTILRSTISNNRDLNSQTGVSSLHGGGLSLEHFGTATITNSTFSGNSSVVRAGGIHLLGRATLDHVTIYNNTAPEASEIFVRDNPLNEDASGDGFGPNNKGPSEPGTIGAPELPCIPNCYLGPGVLTFRNTIIANTVTSDPCGGTGTFTSQGDNLVFPTDAGCGADEPSDINNQNPNLTALADNGGPTMTHNPNNGSPVVNAGTLTVGHDQRGIFRPQGPAPDIGSVERILTPGYVQGIKSVEGDYVVGGTVTYTIVLTNHGSCIQPNDPHEDEFTDMFPSQLEVDNASADGGIVTQNGNDVRWNGSIAIGASVTITVEATIVEGGEISNTGTVNYDSDCNGDNDTTFGTGAPAGPGPVVISVPAVEAAIPTLSWLMIALLACTIALVAVRMRM